MRISWYNFKKTIERYFHNNFGNSFYQQEGRIKLKLLDGEAKENVGSRRRRRLTEVQKRFLACEKDVSQLQLELFIKNQSHILRTICFIALFQGSPDVCRSQEWTLLWEAIVKRGVFFVF